VADAGQPRRRWARWGERLLDPLSWSAAGRSLLVVAIVLPGSLIFVALLNFKGGWPYLPPDADPDAIRRLGRLAWWILVPWSLLLVAGLVAQKKRPQTQVLVHLTIQLYAFTIAAFTYITGPLYSPGWIAALGGAMVGFLLFERRAALLGVSSFLILLAAAIAAGRRGLLPASPVGAGSLAGGGLLGFALTALVFMGLTLALAAFLVARWRERERRVIELSRTDGLTGLTNRRRFIEVFEREFSRARRHARPLACILIDLDHFKAINDNHGHLMGDQVLVVVAEALGRGLRDADVVARYGGEEFALLLPDTTLAGAEEVAARCLRQIREARVEGVTRPITASMGVAALPREDVTKAEDLLREADAAMYRAKDAGRDRLMIAS